MYTWFGLDTAEADRLHTSRRVLSSGRGSTQRHWYADGTEILMVHRDDYDVRELLMRCRRSGPTSEWTYEVGQESDEDAAFSLLKQASRALATGDLRSARVNVGLSMGKHSTPEGCLLMERLDAGSAVVQSGALSSQGPRFPLDELATSLLAMVLAHLPDATLQALMLVCKAWRRAVQAAEAEARGRVQGWLKRRGIRASNQRANDRWTGLLRFMEACLSRPPTLLAIGGAALCVSSTGQCLSWGTPEPTFESLLEERPACLGLGTGSTKALQPRQVRLVGASGTVREVAAGNRHSLLLTNRGTVLACGSAGGNDKMHINYDEMPRDIQIRYDPERNVCGNALGFGGSAMDMADAVSTPKVVSGLSSLRIVHIAASRGVNASFSAAVSALGELFMFGDGGSGQLGLGSRLGVSIPMPVALPQPVHEVSCGEEHTLVLTRSGQAFAFGHGIFGRLGLGDEEDRLSPERVPTDGPVRCVSAGEHHSLIVLCTGELLAFGEAEHAELGIPLSQIVAFSVYPYIKRWDEEGCIQEPGHSHVQLTPRTVVAFTGTHVTRASAGASYSLVLTSQGHLFSFGEGWGGKLGLGHQRDEPTPTRIQGFDEQRVTRICAGFAVSMASTEDGRVWVFGRGHLGIKKNREGVTRCTPIPLDKAHVASSAQVDV